MKVESWSEIAKFRCPYCGGQLTFHGASESATWNCCQVAANNGGQLSAKSHAAEVAFAEKAIADFVNAAYSCGINPLPSLRSQGRDCVWGHEVPGYIICEGENYVVSVSRHA